MSLANDCDEMAAYILKQGEKYSIVSDVLLRAAAALRDKPVLGECEDCGHTIITPLRHLPPNR